MMEVTINNLDNEKLLELKDFVSKWENAQIVVNENTEFEQKKHFVKHKKSLEQIKSFRSNKKSIPDGISSVDYIRQLKLENESENETLETEGKRELAKLYSWAKRTHSKRIENYTREDLYREKFS